MSKQREAARRIVEQQKAREKRRTVTLWTSVSVVLVLVIAGLIGWAVLAGQQRDTAGKVITPASAVDGTAFAVGNGPVVVDLYEDFMCPICRQFEASDGATIQQLASAHTVTVRYHPIAILDEMSNGTRYSTRSAAASAAAADGGKFSEYHKVLFDNQPPEGGNGLTDARLIELGRSVGLTDPAFADAITGKKYWPWTTMVTEEASARGVTGTPTVLVAGKQLPNLTPAALKQAVQAASR